MTVYLTKEIIRRNECFRAERAAGGTPAERTLGDWVLDAVREVKDADLKPIASRDACLACQPRELLAMLTYCYAIGVSGSEDIERMMGADARFRELCGNEFPDARRLRRFRRDNCHIMQQCLENALRAAGGNGTHPCTAADDFAREAAARIERAMFIDRMEAEI